MAKVHYLPFLPAGAPQRRVYEAQCTAPGSTFSFDVKGGLAEAFAVSTACRSSSWRSASAGPSRSPAIPATTTHSGVPADVRARIGVGDATIRLSIGIEHPDDLLADLAQALVASKQRGLAFRSPRLSKDRRRPCLAPGLFPRALCRALAVPG